MKRPIAIGLAPNLTFTDVRIALQKISNLFLYARGGETNSLEKWFEKYFSVKSAVAFTSGRGALYAILRGLEVGKGDEVIVQAFTCSAVIQPILTVGALPIYVDITSSLGADPFSVEKRITQKTKAIIIQHTFGIPANIDVLQAIATKHKIPLIEDCAHTIGATYKKRKLGTFGIASIFSFGRDKAFSCVSGGVAITSDKNLAERIEKLSKQKGYPSAFWTFQQLLHPVVFYFSVMPLYNNGFGKLILIILQKLRLLSLPVDKNRRVLAEEEVKKLPPALSAIALEQLKYIEKVNDKRVMLVEKYSKEFPENVLQIPLGIPLLRYPMLVENSEQCIKALRKKHLYIGNWYSHVIDPKGVSLKNLGYTHGSCPQAEKIASHIINLPTYNALSEKDVYTILRALKPYVTDKGNNQ